MDVTFLLAGFGGFMVGITTWPRVVRWIHSIWIVIQDRKRDPTHRSHWRLLMVLAFHSGPWMLAVLMGLAVLILPLPHAEGWNGFFYGLLAGIAFMALMATILVRNLLKRRAQLAAQSAKQTTV